MALSADKAIPGRKALVECVRDEDFKTAFDIIKTMISGNHRTISPLSLKYAHTVLRECNRVLKMSTGDTECDVYKQDVLSNIETLDSYLRKDEKNAELREKLEEIRAIGILFSYGDYLADTCKSYRSILKKEVDKDFRWGDKQITEIWKGLLADEQELQEWVDGGWKGEKPPGKYIYQLRQIAEQTNTAFEVIRKVIQGYHYRNTFVHYADLHRLAEVEDWQGLSTRVASDEQVLMRMTAFHPLFKSLKESIQHALQAYKSKFFKTFETKLNMETLQLTLTSFEVHPEILAEIKKKEESKAQEHQQKEEKQQIEEDAKAHAISVIVKAAAAGSLDCTTAKIWDSLIETEKDCDKRTKNLQEKKKKINADIKKSKQALIEREKELAKVEEELEECKISQSELALEYVGSPGGNGS